MNNRAFITAVLTLSGATTPQAAPNPPCSQSIPVLAGGAFVQTGDRLGDYYLAGNTPVDYFGGGPKTYRNWFVFALPAFPGPLQRAELRLPAGTTVSAAGTETWELHAV